jgi:hypothetical protein
MSGHRGELRWPFLFYGGASTMLRPARRGDGVSYKNFAIQLGEAIKWDSSVNGVHRTFSALVELPVKEHPSVGITSQRAQAVYDWVMTIAGSALPESSKAGACRNATLSLVVNDKEQERLTKLLPMAGAVPTKSGGTSYVNAARIASLRRITKVEFDLTKLIRLCEELNCLCKPKLLEYGDAGPFHP